MSDGGGSYHQCLGVLYSYSSVEEVSIPYAGFMSTESTNHS